MWVSVFFPTSQDGGFVAGSLVFHWKWVPMVLQPVLPRCVSGALPWLLQHVSWDPARFPCFLLHGVALFFAVF